MAAPASVARASPAGIEHKQAIETYLDMWEQFAVAAETADWQSPRLAENATGKALSTLSHELRLDHLEGVVWSGRPVLQPWVSSADPPEAPTTVVISDCADSSYWIKYRTADGQLAIDDPLGRHQVRAVVKQVVDGSWKVMDFVVQAAGTC